MCMNDAHIYCTAEQIEPELHAVLDMYAKVYALLGIDELRDPAVAARSRATARDKYADDPEAWA